MDLSTEFPKVVPQTVCEIPQDIYIKNVAWFPFAAS
jgi:hypothetical protein